jgi:hypothetical protein
MEVSNLELACRQRLSVTASAFVVTNPPGESNSSRLSVIWKQFGHFNGSKVSPSMFPILRGADEILQGGLVQLLLLQPGAALC